MPDSRNRVADGIDGSNASALVGDALAGPAGQRGHGRALAVPRPPTDGGFTGTLFAITSAAQCAEDLAYGPSSSMDDVSPFFCVDCDTSVHDTWTQASARAPLQFVSMVALGARRA